MCRLFQVFFYLLRVCYLVSFFVNKGGRDNSTSAEMLSLVLSAASRSCVNAMLTSRFANKSRPRYLNQLMCVTLTKLKDNSRSQNTIVF